ncbi:hypothetical protein KOR34_38550 [Posidoniimonas corsicana]|uniref:O-Antigen ligase n=2 Tax=Posidoniimonas corsicana TaxID=1938618 RepID=A0A5C5V812_9BACT|nr:hypothetical protein KOR34_38550 [Posidoniimonas corsicana]
MNSTAQLRRQGTKLLRRRTTRSLSIYSGAGPSARLTGASHTSAPSLASLAVPLMFAPVFWGTHSLRINLGYLCGGGILAEEFAVHASLLVCGLGAFFLFVAGGVQRSVRWFAIYAACWLTLSCLYGLRIESGWPNVLFYLQTLTPVFALAAGNRIASSPRDVQRLNRLTPFVTVASLTLIWVFAITKFGTGALLHERMRVIHDLAVLIPQYQNYYPFCVVISFNFALANYLYGQRSSRTLTVLAAHGLILPLCWSRTALLGFAASALVQSIVRSLASRGGGGRILSLAFCAIAAAPFVWSAMGVTERMEAIGAADVADSDYRRWDYLLEGLTRSWNAPLFGDAFVPARDTAASHAADAVPRLFHAHNQYVDLLLRGGWLYAIALVAFGVQAARRLWSVLRARSDTIPTSVRASASASLGTLAAAAVGANFQLFFIQLQTATPLFFVLGAAYRLAQLHRSGRSRISFQKAPETRRRLSPVA